MLAGHRRGFGSRRAAAFCTLLTLAAAASTAGAATRSAGVEFGATAGFGARADLTLHDFTRDLPLSLRVGLGYAGHDAGDALAARRVFINNNTNGTPVEAGHTWQMRLDLVHPLTRVGKVPVNLGVGVRKAWFTGTFDYVGGNEKFDVTCRPWGLGLLLDTAFAVGERADFTLAVGVDRYFGSTLEGHDTAYSPDGTVVNQTEDYTWDAADDAINQPTWEAIAVLGVRWRLGR
jgi:hypothetical protein